MIKNYKLSFVFLIICLLFISLSQPSLSDAAFTVETGNLDQYGNPWPYWPIAQFTARYGNNVIGATWELSHNWDNGPAQDAKQYVWTSGVDVPFTFIHDDTAGTTTLTLAGGTSTTWNFTPPFWAEDIWILARSDNVNFTSRIDNLSLDGSPVGVSIVGQNNDKYLRIHRVENLRYKLGKFTLTGTINFSWMGPVPPPHVQALFTITRYRYPTGANTYMIVFIALLAISTGFLFIKKYRIQ